MTTFLISNEENKSLLFVKIIFCWTFLTMILQKNLILRELVVIKDEFKIR